MTGGMHVEFKDVSKVFGDVRAVDRVSFTVEPGEILGVIGYSGAGKSTLVRLVNGLDSASEGEILLDGTNIVGFKERQLRTLRRDIGMIFQQFNLLDSLNAAGNVGYPLKIAGVDRAKRKPRVAELLEFVGLSDRATNYPEQLSGGQKQRVGIARALATNPRLLLADEATSALDPTTTQEVLEVLRRINKELGITIIVITHEMEVVRSLADKVLVMEDGRVVEAGSVYDVFSAPQTAVAAKFVATSLRNTPDEVETEDLRAHPGRLFTIELSEHSGFFEASALLIEGGGEISVVHGGVTTLQQKSFGKVTVRVNGPEAVVENFYSELQAKTAIQEISTDEVQ